MRKRFRRPNGGEVAFTDASAEPSRPETHWPDSFGPDQLSPDPAGPDTPGGDGGDTGPGPGSISGSDTGAGFDAVLARQLGRADDVIDPIPGLAAVGMVEPFPEPDPPTSGDAAAGLRPTEGREPVDRLDASTGQALAPEIGAGRGIDAAGPGPAGEDFWDRFDRAMAEAELASIPPAAVVAVVGPLPAAAPTVRRCQDRHWMGACDVFVLTQRDGVASDPDWTVISQPSELVAVLDEGRSDFPLLVLDVPHDLPAFVQPLVARLRQSGVGLIHYVLDDDPDDEDLATWYGELGRPSVLDLASSAEPRRVLELIDRGDPVVSIAGHDLSPELLLAFRVDAAAEIHWSASADTTGGF